MSKGKSIDRSDLGMRMKDYESIPKSRLIRRMPVIIRIDGKAFHSFTRGFKRPFDNLLIKTMQQTAKYLCENIQGCVLSYQQSDEISLVLVDYQIFASDAWFDNEVQKMASIAASMATMAFNKFFEQNVQDFGYSCCYDPDNDNLGDEVVKGREDDYELYKNVYMKKLHSAMFDARCFNLSKDEVTNYIYWRQLDATRNSVQMVGRANFSHRQLQNKSCNEIRYMLMMQKNINWNDLPTYKKRGSCCIKENYYVDKVSGKEEEPQIIVKDGGKFEVPEYVKRSRWIIDNDIPIFSGENRNYIDRLIYVGE